MSKKLLDKLLKELAPENKLEETDIYYPNIFVGNNIDVLGKSQSFTSEALTVKRTKK
jgi:hypothetical protein